MKKFQVQPIIARERTATIRQPSDLRNLPGLDWPENREAFYVLLLDARHRLAAAPHLVSLGTLNASLVHPREVFGPAYAVPGVAAVIVLHNHPSGDPSPSGDDLDLTRRLDKVGDLLGLALLDHVIVAGDEHTSIREFGWPS